MIAALSGTCGRSAATKSAKGRRADMGAVAGLGEGRALISALQLAAAALGQRPARESRGQRDIPGGRGRPPVTPIRSVTMNRHRAAEHRNSDRVTRWKGRSPSNVFAYRYATQGVMHELTICGVSATANRWRATNRSRWAPPPFLKSVISDRELRPRRSRRHSSKRSATTWSRAITPRCKGPTNSPERSRMP